MLPDQPRYYINDTGTGNTLNLSHPRVLQMVTDSLRYWVQEMHVDGFRFDLGTILAREPYGFDEGGGFLDSCRQDPVLSSVKLIAEPWDCGPGGYQVGGFPPGWAEWNDKFRDDTRRFWKGDSGMAPAMASRLCASADLFNKRGRRAWASVNFLTAHDGFTLRDVVSYNDKHNEANGENNQDGNNSNHSWNHGVEGETDDEAINEARRRQARSMLGTLLLSQGTPMILAGDEMGRTQQGNNNTYCQDNELNWISWNLEDWQEEQVAFVKRLAELRHRYGILRRNRFMTGELVPNLNVKDVTWINATGDEMRPEDWGDGNMKCFGMLVDGRARVSGVQRRGTDVTMLIVMNAHHDVVQFTLPDCTGGKGWDLVLDSNDPKLGTEEVPAERFAIGETYDVTGTSLVLFALRS